MTSGPIQTGMDVYEDFPSYKSNIYYHTWGSRIGAVSVKIAGWGEKDGTDYWIVANSWGTDWGIDGYFKIRVNSCNIDHAGIAGTADLKF